MVQMVPGKSTLGNILSKIYNLPVVHLTYYKDIPHGMANGLLLGEYLERTKAVLPEKTAAYERALGMSLAEIKRFLTDCLPCNESFSAEELSEWARTSINAKNVAICPFKVNYSDEVEIYEKCLLK